MEEYNEVPTIISKKDLDYLSDMYNWNFNACKLANSFYPKVEDEQIKEIIQRAYKIHKENSKNILNILQ